MQDINLAVCGHAGHGKSTLLGKAVAELKMVTQKEIQAAREAAKAGKDPSYVFANLVFRSKKPQGANEAARGITYQTAIIRFEFKEEGRRITALDTPGQEDYTNNLFIGLFQADAALLLVAANNGVKPVTEQILRILVGFQIPLVGVSITKMDRLDYSQEAYESLVFDVRCKLDEFNIPHEDLPFFPTSAYHSGRDIMEPGEGVTERHELGWFEGPTFRDFLASISLKKDRLKHSLRAVVHPNDAYDNVPGIGKAVTALVETGTLSKGESIIFEPISTMAGEPILARVRDLELTRGHIATPGIKVELAQPRQLVGVALNTTHNESLRDLFRGCGVVLGPEGDRPSVAQEFILEVAVFAESFQLQVGGQWVLHAHVDHVTITVEEIIAFRLGDRETGEVTEWTEEPFEAIDPGDWGRIRVRAHRPIALETSETCPPLSRIVIRRENKAVAYGHCQKILARRLTTAEVKERKEQLKERSGEARRRRESSSERPRPKLSGGDGAAKGTA